MFLISLVSILTKKLRDIHDRFELDLLVHETLLFWLVFTCSVLVIKHRLNFEFNDEAFKNSSNDEIHF